MSPMLMTRENINQLFQTDNAFVSGSEIDFRTNPVVFGDLFSMQRNIDAHNVYLEDYQQDIEIIITQIDQFLSSVH
jgi:hypothetical protein